MKNTPLHILDFLTLISRADIVKNLRRMRSHEEIEIKINLSDFISMPGEEEIKNLFVFFRNLDSHMVMQDNEVLLLPMITQFIFSKEYIKFFIPYFFLRKMMMVDFDLNAYQTKKERKKNTAS